MVSMDADHAAVRAVLVCCSECHSNFTRMQYSCLLALDSGGVAVCC